MERTDRKLSDYAHLGPAQGCANRSRCLRGGQISLDLGWFPRYFGWPLLSEEAGDLLVSFGDGGGSGGSSCGAEFHDRNIACD